MARGFLSTYGAGTTDRLEWSGRTSYAQYSLAVWYYLRALPGATGFRISEATLWYNLQLTTTPTLRLDRFTSGVSGSWDLPTTTLALRRWHHLVLTQTGTSAPLVYLNGFPIGVIEATAPTGTESTGGATVYLGNRDTGDRGWDGMLAEFALWNRVLTPTQARQVYSDGARASRSGMMLYAPLTGPANESVSPYLATSLVVGTRVQPHPPVLPWARVRNPLRWQEASRGRRAPLYSAVDELAPSQIDHVRLAAGAAAYRADLGALSLPQSGRVRLELDAAWEP